MAKEYPNFYENLKEARMRLQFTVVTYDDMPVYVHTVMEHTDGFLRAYIEPLTGDKIFTEKPWPVTPVMDYLHSDNATHIDKFLLANPALPVARKKLNSPSFNKFRPFPLGMCNYTGSVYYLERHPQRHTQQGMTQQMLASTSVEMDGKRQVPPPNILKQQVTDTIAGTYPSFPECIRQLDDPKIANTAAAFNRNFAVVRGPVETLYLAYKSDVVAFLPFGNSKELRLGQNYRHLQEVIQELELFAKITVR